MNLAHVITANNTDNGAVVYLAEAAGKRRWSERFEDAAVWHDEAEGAEALAWSKAQEGRVTDPYLMKVEVEDGHVRPLSARERIRLEGPAVTLERLGYAHAAAAAKEAIDVQVQ